MSFLRFRTGYVVTPVLLIANFVLFLTLAVMNQGIDGFSNMSLLRMGANFTPLVEGGQYWRWFTAMFLHLGLMHFAFNAFSLVILGRIIEPLMGSAVFAVVYLSSGVAGNVLSFFINDNIISAGASGAIFGLFGVFIALLLGKIVRADLRKVWAKNILVILGLNIVLGILLPIDNAAHFGGLICGTLLGFASLPLIKRRLKSYMARSTGA